jgi:hypothetical protein
MQEPLPCEWSNFGDSEKFGKITIPEGIPQRANLFGILKQGGPVFPIIPYSREELFDGVSIPGKYTVCVAVSAKDACTGKETFFLEWEDYDNIKLTKDTFGRAVPAQRAHRPRPR